MCWVPATVMSFVRMHAADPAFDDHEALPIVLAGWMHRHHVTSTCSGHSAMARCNLSGRHGAESAQRELVAHARSPSPAWHRAPGHAGRARDGLDLCGLGG
jgi:hypothetical protein